MDDLCALVEVIRVRNAVLIFSCLAAYSSCLVNGAMASGLMRTGPSGRPELDTLPVNADAC